MSLIGTRIGNFRVTELAGEGGMGEVYIGYDERLKRRVALKVIRGEKRIDESIKARLLREAEILSRLDHPNICRIHDLLSTEDADVLVLELISGRTLGKTSIETLTRAAKLKLAIQMGEALADAHAHSVVHRDLKPENVMIDERGDVKVLDFGLAHSWVDEKTISLVRPAGEAPARPEPRPAGAGFVTEHGVVLGTPMYMSLEQARSRRVTAASDMYSFGLLLQWLFTGTPPYPTDLSPTELFERAAEGETLPVRGAGDRLKRLIERLKSVDPTSRPTAVDTVSHLKRIESAPRRRAKRLVTAGVIAILLAGIIVTGFSLSRVKNSERLERIALERSEKMSSFLVDMWVSPSPMERGRDVKVVDVLAYGRDKVLSEFRDDPLTRNTLLNHLATTYRRLSEYETAEEIITDGLADSRRSLGPMHVVTIGAMIELGILYSYDERFPEAEALFREALDASERTLTADNELVVYAKVMLAEILDRRAGSPEARTLLEEALDVIRGNEVLEYKLGPKALLGLGNILDREEDLPAAEKVFRELVESYERMGDTENPNYIAALGSLARIHMVQGRHEDGLRYMRRGLDLSIRINGERSRTTLALLINLGQAMADCGAYEEALVHTERGYRIFREIFGERAPDTAFIAVNYANMLIHLDRFDEAEALLEEAVALNVELLGTDHPNTFNAEFVRARLFFESGRLSEAKAAVETVIDRSAAALGPDRDVALECRDLLGRILFEVGEVSGAEAIHREVLQARREVGETRTVSMSDTLFHLAKCRCRRGQAEASCRPAEEALRIRSEVFGADHPGTREAAALLVEAFGAAGRAEEAGRLLAELGVRE